MADLKGKILAGKILIQTQEAEDFEIGELQLEWGFKHRNLNEYSMQIPINLSNTDMIFNDQNIEISLDEVILPLVKCLRPGPENSIKIKVSGNSNIDLDPVAQIKIPMLIETGSFSIRFSSL